ncbi:aminotransferase [Inquilinus limosus]|uniref:aspartate transaminase n=1 Tax=Inquilinus limosus MP06 TaxID=1398085 RepID=A0A0A0DB74_9PROT|nr:aminotransferase [Inquilinus limosus]KGM35941.1 aminotransferase [Inquilinus limosus MP06]
MKPGNAIFSGLGTTVFEVMSRLARQHSAVNLGQGFPDGKGPEDVLRVAATAITDGWNQYPPMLGLPELRQAVAAHEKRFYGLEVDPDSEVVVTSGATEALAAALFALIEPGDEVVLFEPLYDAYLPLVRRAGGVPKFVHLTPPDWSFDRAALARAFSPRTKAVLFNNPLNPAAKVFGAAELDLLAEFVEGADAYAICDEVYEHLVFDGRRHQPLIARPGMRERCLKIGSAGKTFSLTGWKVGYVTAAPALATLLGKAHQFLTFTTPPNLQAAVAYGLAKGDDYFDGLTAELQGKRDRFAAGLQRLGLAALPCDGTYFVNLDIGSTGFDGDDQAFCRHLIEEVGVAAIPVSAFYAETPLPTVARFCFAKQDAVLDEALARLAKRFG